MDIGALLRAELVVDATRFDNSIDAAEKRVEQFDRTATAGFKRAGASAKALAGEVRGAAARMAADNDNVGGSVRRMADSFSYARVRVTAYAAAIALVAGGALALSDSAKQTSAQLLLVAGSAQKAAEASARLRDVAAETRSRFAPTVELYAKLARSTEGLGISSERLLNVTRTIGMVDMVFSSRRRHTR